MKIAIIGSGAVGCFYGARLARAGQDVHFLMRRELDAARRHGLTIRSCDGDFHIRPKVYADAAEIGVADLVVCALKATALDAAEDLLRPCVGPHTRILALMNGLGIEEKFAAWFGPDRILGALAFVCINRGEPGVIHHLSHGRLTFGHLADDRRQTEEVAALFADAGLPVFIAPSLRQARWEKLMWNIPFSTLAITAGGVTTQEILHDPGLTELARRLMHETAGAANADGCAIDILAHVERNFANTRIMGAYRPSMLVDYQNKSALEVEVILGEPVRRARALGVPVPTIEVQYHLTGFLDRLNRGVVEPGDEMASEDRRSR